MAQINVAIVGVGNCASSLVQGVSKYSLDGKLEGLKNPQLGTYSPSDIRFVAAFDIDSRKVGKPLFSSNFFSPKQHLDF